MIRGSSDLVASKFRGEDADGNEFASFVVLAVQNMLLTELNELLIGVCIHEILIRLLNEHASPYHPRSEFPVHRAYQRLIFHRDKITGLET